MEMVKELIKHETKLDEATTYNKTGCNMIMYALTLVPRERLHIILKDRCVICDNTEHVILDCMMIADVRFRYSDLYLQ
ncbi:hypothetical protein P3W45_001750 [Vairimorpha bombi]